MGSIGACTPSASHDACGSKTSMRMKQCYDVWKACGHMCACHGANSWETTKAQLYPSHAEVLCECSQCGLDSRRQ